MGTPMRSGAERGFYTTGQVATLIGAAPNFVRRAIDDGHIPGAARLPGSDDRRVPADAVRRFLLSRGLPLPPDLQTFRCLRVLAVTPDAALAAALLVPANGERGVSVTHAADPYFASAELFGAEPFDVAVLDALAGRGACLGLARHLRQRRLPTRAVGLLTEDDGDGDEWTDAGCGVVLRRPAGVGQVAGAVRKVCG